MAYFCFILLFLLMANGLEFMCPREKRLTAKGELYYRKPANKILFNHFLLEEG